MGFLSGIARSIGSVIKPLAQTALRAIAPAATSMLSNVVGDLFTAGRGALNSFMSALPLPSPFKDLAKRLLGQGLDAVQNLAQGSLEKWLNSLVNRLAPRTTSDGVTVTPDTMPNRTESIINNTPSFGGTSSSSSAATGGGSGPISSGVNGTQVGGYNTASGAPKASDFGDLSKPANLEAYQAAQFQYQQTMNNINQFWQMMSNVFKAQSDTQRTISGNLR